MSASHTSASTSASQTSVSRTSANHAGQDLTLVIGATGKTGRSVTRQLEVLGVPTRAVSRSTPIPFDWNDQSTWARALDGVRHAYVSFVPDLAAPGAQPIITAFATMAKEQGVERLVLLSGRGEEGAQRCEEIVLGIDARWTVVRASWFSQNFSEGYFQPGIQGGLLVLPAGAVREPFIDVEDIAEVAVAALTRPGHEGEVYEVTGPRLMTFAEAVAEIAEVTGRNIGYRQIPTADYVAAATAQGAPQEIADLLTFLFDTVLDGRNESTADGVERALGRPARDFRDYVERTFAGSPRIWSPSPEQVVRRLIEEVVNEGRMEVLPELIDASYVHRSPGEVTEGRDGLAALIGSYRSAFPDLHVEIDGLVATEDTTVIEITLTGTHRGDFLGNPATGRSVRVHGMVRSRFRDGRIVEEWEVLDLLTLFERLQGVTA